MVERFTDSYVTMFINSAYSRGNELEFLGLLFLFLGRILPIIALSPFFGARVMPNPVKVALALSLFVIFVPYLLILTKKPIPFDTLMLVFFFKEVFIGLLIGFIMGIFFTVVQGAGMIIDHQRGGASLMVNDPTIQNQSSPLGTLFNMVLIVIFFLVDGPFLFLDAIVKSYEVLPIDEMLNPTFFDKTSPFWVLLVQLFNEIMVLTIQICSPALIAILMTDVFLGIANRLAPQVQITFLGMPLKSLLGLTVVCFGWTLMTSEFAKQSLLWVKHVLDVIQMMKPLSIPIP